MAKWCFEIFREEVSQSPEQLSRLPLGVDITFYFSGGGIDNGF
jgi:hypothetical protein